MNNNIKKKLITISIGLTTLSTLMGCSNKNNNNNNVKTTPTSSYQKEVTETNTPTPSNTPVPTNTPTPEVITDTPTPTILEENKEITYIKNYFKELINDVKSLKDNDKVEEALEKGKSGVILLIDFIFFDKDINGYKYSDFKDDFKLEFYSYLQDLDSILMKIDNNYKEDVGEKYNIVKDFTKEKIGDAKEYIINKIGQDKYDEIINKKDEIWEETKNKFSEYKDKALKYTKEKYENFKENDNESD